jgi:hypothetical protein
MATWVWVLIVIVVLLAIVLIAMAARRRSSERLRQRFGPEYDRAVAGTEDRRAAEAELRARERQRAQFDIRPLPEADRARYAAEWREIQERFVDTPGPAVTAADVLITRVMDARGYPMQDFSAQADLLSVDHPAVVENYRFAHGVEERARAEQTTTEELREALLRYRSLFGELLQTDSGEPAVQAEPAGTGTADTAAASPADTAAASPADTASAGAGPDGPAGTVPGSPVIPQGQGLPDAQPAPESQAMPGNQALPENQPMPRGGR